MSAWLTTEDVAGELKYVPATIRDWCARGVFPGARKFPPNNPRGRWRIPRGDVETLKRQQVEPAVVPRDRLDELMDAALAKSA